MLSSFNNFVNLSLECYCVWQGSQHWKHRATTSQSQLGHLLSQVPAPASLHQMALRDSVDEFAELASLTMLPRSSKLTLLRHRRLSHHTEWSQNAFVSVAQHRCRSRQVRGAVAHVEYIAGSSCMLTSMGRNCRHWIYTRERKRKLAYHSRQLRLRRRWKSQNQVLVA